MSKWASSERPRGVFLFGGPTGVGKTETAVQLARIISGSANNLIRVDCNTLQPTGHQKTSVIWTLLGVPPGYMGHGEGGLLSKIREKPNSVILFDEFEKADSAVGKLLLQILDTGVQRDNNGTILDFRQSLIIFTSNLGCDYNEAPASLGFSSKKDTDKKVPTVDEEQLRSELKLMGYGPEFLARIHNIFLFRALKDNDISEVIKKLIESLQPFIEDQGYQLTTAATFFSDVAEAYAPRDGVRGIVNKVRSNFTRSISEAERRGDLKGIKTICLHFGEGTLKRDGDALHMHLAI
jgi:ATP-dependent Clp protease ATP-binding subunit ClpA